MASLEKRAKDSRQQVGQNFLPSLVLSLGISSEKIICHWKMINFYLAISGLSKLHSVHSGEYLSVIIIIIIGLPVAPNYKMGFLCRKKPEKPEKKCENNLYFSKHYMYIKTTALHNRQPNEPPLWGLVQILKTSTVHCNYNYWTIIFLLNQAIQLHLLGKVKEALSKISIAIETNPSVADFHVFR